MKVYQGEGWGLNEKRLSATGPQNITGYYLKKWSSSRATLLGHQSGLGSLGERPASIFRLAEMYLIAAEALNECKQAPDAEVYKYLNVVRKRAGIPDVEEAWKNAKDPGRVECEISSVKNGTSSLLLRDTDSGTCGVGKLPMSNLTRNPWGGM